MPPPTPCVSFIGIVDFSEKARWLYMTESVTELLGFEPHELIGRPSLELVHPDEFPRVKQLHYDTITQDKAAVLVYLRMKHKDPFRGYVLCGVSRTVVHNVLVGSVSFASPGAKALHNASTAQEITVITPSAANFEFRRWHDPSPMPPSPIPESMLSLNLNNLPSLGPPGPLSPSPSASSVSAPSVSGSNSTSSRDRDREVFGVESYRDKDVYGRDRDLVETYRDRERDRGSPRSFHDDMDDIDEEGEDGVNLHGTGRQANGHRRRRRSSGTGTADSRDGDVGDDTSPTRRRPRTTSRSPSSPGSSSHHANYTPMSPPPLPPHHQSNILTRRLTPPHTPTTPIISFSPLPSKSFRTAFILDRFSDFSPILYASNSLLLPADLCLGRSFYDYVVRRDEGVVRSWIGCVKGWGVNESGQPSDGGFGFGRFELLAAGRESNPRMPDPPAHPTRASRHHQRDRRASQSSRGARPAKYTRDRDRGGDSTANNYTANEYRDGNSKGVREKERGGGVGVDRDSYRDKERDRDRERALEKAEEGERFMVDAIFSAHSDGLMVILRRASDV